MLWVAEPAAQSGRHGMRFQDKTALITGGSSGIGLATAKRIAAEGGRVAITGTSDKHLEEARAALPDNAIIIRNDAADPAQAQALAEEARTGLGRIDALFLNAGYGRFGPNEGVDQAFFDHMTNVNVRGPVLQMSALIPILNDGGSVVLTASVSPYLGQAQGAIYAATKGAVTALARSWAADLAGRNIRVNSIAPGPIATNFAEGMQLSEEELRQFAQQILQRLALKRFGTAEEVAAVACFLLSDDAAYVTGSQYFVDGGMTFR
jgi:NAD(P)-dependent dehydrogenase (short-subunit alcohol dehydrogenase family)